jgi:hypothetical protein
MKSRGLHHGKREAWEWTGVEYSAKTVEKMNTHCGSSKMCGSA